jgi:hypothetical protein
MDVTQGDTVQDIPATPAEEAIKIAVVFLTLKLIEKRLS